MTDKKTVDDYLKLYQDIHDGGQYLVGGKAFRNTTHIFDGSNFYEKLWGDFKIWSEGKTSFRVLDFGCGKAKHLFEPHLEGKMFHQYFKGACQEYFCYDPGFKKYEVAPHPNSKFDALICADVMEHVPEDAVDETIVRMRRWTTAEATCFFSISGLDAKKSFMDGENLHCNVQSMEYWTEKMKLLNRRVVMAYTSKYATRFYRRL